jgi:hypothetical protein
VEVLGLLKASQPPEFLLGPDLACHKTVHCREVENQLVDIVKGEDHEVT